MDQTAVGRKVTASLSAQRVSEPAQTRRVDKYKAKRRKGGMVIYYKVLRLANGWVELYLQVDQRFYHLGTFAGVSAAVMHTENYDTEYHIEIQSVEYNSREQFTEIERTADRLYDVPQAARSHAVQLPNGKYVWREESS
jgi:hypothetical protein